MNDQQPERTRTFSWENPLIGAQQALSMSGIEYLQAMIDGVIPPPPIAHALNFNLIEVGEGFAVFTIQPAEYHYNPIGSVHGGVACTVLDSALGCAIHTLLPAGTTYTTLEIKVNFIRALSAKTGLLRCEANAIYVGGRIATSEAKLIDHKGKLYAHATTTCMIFRRGNGEDEK